ncbi:hypothetical protein HJC23_005880 [Cyclotella cryptica]|uniref:Uncharacterized protein n=1 Tax=Cyclotella cryptica TaxID=29204 RepID=A0ABD3R0X1_9STRA
MIVCFSDTSIQVRIFLNRMSDRPTRTAYESATIVWPSGQTSSSEAIPMVGIFHSQIVIIGCLANPRKTPSFLVEMVLGREFEIETREFLVRDDVSSRNTPIRDPR